MDLIAALRTFLRVAEVGSFSAVAEDRGVTQPAVSRQVSALEEHFGTRLVQRSTHAVTLTEEGRDLVPAAQQLVDSVDALQERTGRRRTKPVGRVRLSVPVPLGLYFSSKLNSLLKKHDELSIDLILHDRLRDLIEEGIDLQVCVGEVNDSALISRRIGATTAFLVAAPEYLKGRAAPKEPADLQQHDCIIYHRWGRDDVWWFAGPEGAVSASVRGRFRANNSDAVRRAGLSQGPHGTKRARGSATARLHRLSPMGAGRCLVVRRSRGRGIGVRARPISRQQLRRRSPRCAEWPWHRAVVASACR